MPPRFEILDHTETPLGVLCLRRREMLSRPGTFVTEVTVDHEFLMSSHHTDSERALATRAIAWHAGPAASGRSELRVVVGGLGLGYTAKAALDTGSVGDLVVLELLPEVIRWFDDGLVPLAGVLGADSRFHVERADIFVRLAAAPPSELPDLILIDVDHSPDEVLAPANRAFYEPEGLRRAGAWLAPGGILAVWSSAENRAFVEALDSTFHEVRVERIEWRNELIDSDEVDELFLARGPRG